MNINTQYFGTITYSNEELIYFPDGLYGFEDRKKYIPLAFQDGSDALICLQSIEDSEVSFILMNPFQLYEDYNPILSEEDQQQLNCEQDESIISYYVICVIHDSMEESTVNLKCPIAVNTETREARQVILDNPLYKHRHAIHDFIKKED
jgi:flagellar assembly factor FliW